MSQASLKTATLANLRNSVMTSTKTNPTDNHKLDAIPNSADTVSLVEDDEIIDEETLEALEEVKLFEANPQNYKTYRTFEEALKDIFGADYTLPKDPK